MFFLIDKKKKVPVFTILVTCSLHLFQSLGFCFIDGEERTYGGCEGPDAMYVKLISSDGHEFIVKREHALTSGTIKAMLSGPGESLTLCWTRVYMMVGLLCMSTLYPDGGTVLILDSLKCFNSTPHYKPFICRSVCGEWNQWGQLQRDSFSRPIQGLHVLHL